MAGYVKIVFVWFSVIEFRQRLRFKMKATEPERVEARVMQEEL